jgi:hypothetical protein
MFTIDMKQGLLHDIPEIGLVGVFEDEIITHSVVKEDVKFKEINVILNPTIGIKLTGATRWEDLVNNKDITYIQKLLTESTDELKSVSSTFKASNGMACNVSLEFYDSNDILTNIKEKARFVVRFIVVNLTSPSGTSKELNSKDITLLKDAIAKVKGDFELKATMLVDELNRFTGDRKVFATFKL